MIDNGEGMSLLLPYLCWLFLHIHFDEKEVKKISRTFSFHTTYSDFKNIPTYKRTKQDVHVLIVEKSFFKTQINYRM